MKHRAAVLFLLGLAVLAPVLLLASTAMPRVPGWLGAVIEGAALFGALIVFWRAGGLRVRYIVVFAVALALAAAVGAFL